MSQSLRSRAVRGKSPDICESRTLKRKSNSTPTTFDDDPFGLSGKRTRYQQQQQQAVADLLLQQQQEEEQQQLLQQQAEQQHHVSGYDSPQPLQFYVDDLLDVDVGQDLVHSSLLDSSQSSDSSLNTPPHSPSHSSYSEGLLSPYTNPQTPSSEPLTPMTPLSVEHHHHHHLTHQINHPTHQNLYHNLPQQQQQQQIQQQQHQTTKSFTLDKPLTPDYSSSSSHQSKSSPESHLEHTDQTVPVSPNERRSTRSTRYAPILTTVTQQQQQMPKKNIPVRTIEQILAKDYPSTTPSLTTDHLIGGPTSEESSVIESKRQLKKARQSPRSPPPKSKSTWIPKSTLNLSESSSDEEEEGVEGEGEGEVDADAEEKVVEEEEEPQEEQEQVEEQQIEEPEPEPQVTSSDEEDWGRRRRKTRRKRAPSPEITNIVQIKEEKSTPRKKKGGAPLRKSPRRKSPTRASKVVAKILPQPQKELLPQTQKKKRGKNFPKAKKEIFTDDEICDNDKFDFGTDLADIDKYDNEKYDNEDEVESNYYENNEDDIDKYDLDLPPELERELREPSPTGLEVALLREQESFKMIQRADDDADAYERPGKLISIEIWGIMCHDHFQKEWHPRVNYITGENGSGKSAILTAIYLCLGAKQLLTGRGSSLTKSIQYGKNSAKIQLNLTNDGTLDVTKYGNQIGISRSITASGVSRYQIRTAEGTMRSLERKEMDRILTTLQIMVDNPLQFLNQETARNFLRTSDPKKIYQFFYRAMLLGPCELFVEKARGDFKSGRLNILEKHKLLEDLKRNEADLKKKYVLIESLEQAKSKITLLEIEYNWSLVIGCENDINMIKEHINEAQSREASLQKSIDDKVEEQMRLESNLESEDTQLREINERVKAKQEECGKYRKKVQKIHLDLTEAGVHLKNSETGTGKTRKQLKSLEEKVKKIRASDSTNYEKRKSKFQTKKNEIDTALQDVKDRIGELNELVSNYKVRLEESNSAEEEIKSRMRKIDNAKKEYEGMLGNIQKTQSSRYQNFGHDMTSFMNALNTKMHLFKKPPVGPQGACFTVKDPKYTHLVEFILQGSIFQFFVDNQHDQNLLNNQIDQFYGKKGSKKNMIRLTLFLSKFLEKKLDISSGKAKCKFPTLLDMLDIVNDNPLVFNWLVDSNRVERILLFENISQANDFMSDSKKVPKTTFQGYSLDSYLLFPDPKFKIYSKTIKDKATYIQTTKIDNSLQIEKEIRRLKTEYEGIQAEYRVAHQKSQEISSKLSKYNKEINELRKKAVNMQSESETLKANIEMSETPDLASYMEGLDELQKSLKEQEEQTQGFRTTYENLENTLLNAKQKVLDATKELEVFEGKITKIIEERGSVTRKTNEVNRTIEKLDAQKVKNCETKNQFLKQLEKLKTQLNEFKKKAQLKSIRVHTKKKPQQIKDEMECLEQELKTNKYKPSQKASVQREYENARKVAEKVADDITLMEKLIEFSEPTLKLQEDHFNKQKIIFGNNLQSCFYSLITSRQYGGLLDINHDEKTLVYLLSPDNSAEARVKGNFSIVEKNRVVDLKGINDYTSGLSGGERTFATICFMTSLWQAMGAPFYILDEFDVFMDAVNRRASQKILMYHAKNQPEAQFIFFTPLLLEEMPDAKDAKVIKLFPPIRNKSSEEEQAESKPKQGSKGGSRSSGRRKAIK